MSGRGSQILASIMVNAIYEMRNYPAVLIITVLSPLSFLALIFFISGGTLLAVGIVGGLIMSMFSAGTSLQSDLSHLKNDFKLQDMVVASPTKASIYVVGMAISELIYASPGLAILSLLFAMFVHVELVAVLGIIAVMLMMFLMSVSLGFALATFSSDIVQSFAFTRLLSLLFTTLAPVYYPVTYIPLPWRYLAYLSPTTYAAQIGHVLVGFYSIPDGQLTLDWAVLVALTLLFVWVGMSKARWREV
ncbi:MAG TPA: ABC transporter permease [Methanomassiliicoccales archaeon]|nr:ABC transporter permease [Methanomassiliicoccales archaeon]